MENGKTNLIFCSLACPHLSASHNGVPYCQGLRLPRLHELNAPELFRKYLLVGAARNVEKQYRDHFVATCKIENINTALHYFFRGTMISQGLAIASDFEKGWQG